MVLLHGWAFHGGVWAGLREHLSRGFRVHVVDLPGHGRSTAEDGGTFDAWVSAVAGRLPERAVLCGWSLGGQIALELAIREPSKIERVVLTSTTPCFINHGDWAFGIESAALTRFARDLQADYASTLQRFLALQVRGTARGTQTLRSLRRTLFSRGMPAAHALETGLSILLNNDLRPRVGAVSQPALVIHGGRDALCPREAGEWLAQHLPNARLALMPDCGHAPFLSCPGGFMDALERFLHGH